MSTNTTTTTTTASTASTASVHHPRRNYERPSRVPDYHHMAYFWVHSFACWRYLALSFLKSFAISGTRGSSGLGSQSSEQMDNRTLEMVRAGDHWDLKMSRQMLPLLLMLGW